jgi:hypothetical protein
MKKITLYTLLMLSIFSCFRKKSPPNNIESWLELHFPGQFEVMVSNLKMLDVMAQFKGEKQVLLADKSDPEVQFLLNWQKNTVDFGLVPEQVKQAHEYAKNTVSDARSLHKLLKNNHLEKFSVGVIDQAAYIQVFLEPTPAARKQTLELVKAVLDARSEQPQTRIFLELMEEASYQSEFKDIIPQGHWKTGRIWQDEHKIMALHFEWSNALKLSDKTCRWELNPMSKRGKTYTEFSRQQAMVWAEKNLPKPYFMPSNRPYSYDIPETAEPSIRYEFPFYDQELSAEASHLDPEPKGYVVGNYAFDQKVFSQLRKQEEF